MCIVLTNPLQWAIKIIEAVFSKPTQHPPPTHAHMWALNDSLCEFCTPRIGIPLGYFKYQLSASLSTYTSNT